MDYGRSDGVDPLTAALARLPVETSGQGELDWYVNDLIFSSRRAVERSRKRRRLVRVHRIRSA